MAATEVLRDTGALVSVRFFADEAPIDADGDVTVTITRGDGTTLATAAATSSTGEAGGYRYTLAPQANLDKLTLAWTGTFGGLEQTQRTYVDIVGGYYVTLSEIRAQLNLGDSDKFTTAELEQKRRWFETLAERHCGVAFVPRYARVTLNGLGMTTLLLPHPRVRRLLSASVGGVAVTDLADWTLESFGRVTRTASFTRGTANVVIAYEHGYDEPPEDLKEAALIAIRERLLDRKSGDRQISEAVEGGVVRYSVAGPDRPTGIPNVDEVLNSYRQRVPVVA